MFKNYIKIVLRTLHRNKFHSFVNIFGLTIGLVCCLLIFEYVAHEYSFDDFNEKQDELFRVTLTTVKSGGDPYHGATMGYALAPALAEAVPEVVRYARVHPEYKTAVIFNPASLGSANL